MLTHLQRTRWRAISDGGPGGTRTLAPVCEANLQCAGNSAWSMSVTAKVAALNFTEHMQPLKNERKKRYGCLARR